MDASLFIIGTEITRGIITDRHTAFLSGELTHMGYAVKQAVLVPDDGSIEKQLELCAEKSNVILVTGGLGPTSDDMTRRIIARAAGVPLVKNREAWDTLYGRIGSRIYGANEQQTLIPEGFDILPNPNGTACGFAGSFECGGKKVFIASMPGPPAEMQPMFLNHVKPLLMRLAGCPAEQRDEYSVYLIAEAKLEELCRKAYEDLGAAAEGIFWGTRFQQLRTSLYISGPSAEKRMQFVQRLRELAGNELIADGDNVDPCGVFTSYLEENGLTVSCAESCTAGLVSGMLTDRAGSSKWFWGGAATYANEAKVKLLGVRKETLDRYGAVSAECASEMAEGIRAVSGTDVSFSLTGIAGPGGAVEGKPVGTVYMGFSGRNRKTQAVRLDLTGYSRDSMRRRFSVASLILALKYMQGAELIDTVSAWRYI